jgi:hypothetical protein
MSHLRLFAAAAIAVGLATTACNPFHKNANKIERADIPVGERWNAALATPSGLAGAVQIKGSGYLARGDSPSNSKAVIHTSNATPGGIHPWQLRAGPCGSDSPVVGNPTAYSNLKVDKDGTAQGSANLAIPFPTDGSYSIQVLASPSNMGTVIACGNLAPPVH